MAGLYPENQVITMNGESVTFPGVGENGKFTNGDFNNPQVPPSFIPADSINLLMDNVGGAIEALGGTPNNSGGNQVGQAIEAFTAQKVSDRDNAIAAALQRNTTSFGIGYDFGKSRFMIFDFADENHRSIKIKAGTHIRLDIVANGEKTYRWLDVPEDTVYSLNTAITAAAAATDTRTGLENGRNFYIYLAPDGNTAVKLVVSCNSTFPNDISPSYTANNTRKIGQFHTLCVNAGSNLQGNIAEASSCGLVQGDTVLVKQYDSEDENGFYSFYKRTVISVKAGSYYDVVTVSHPLAGFLSGQILPESIFCLSFHPFSNPDGMVYDADIDSAADIYLQSGKGRNTLSEYNATVTDSRPQANHQDDMRHVKKHLLYDFEFASVASGSNEKTAVQGSADPVTTGGHVDTAARRMLSFIGAEDCCGAWWQFLENTGPAGGSGFSTYDGQAEFGSTYGTDYASLAGGDWNDSTNCGSRARNANNARSNVSTNIGGRGSIRGNSSFKRATPAELDTLANARTHRGVAVLLVAICKCRTAFFVFMKTWSNLWNPFVTEENFALAYQKAKKGKSRQNQVARFATNAEVNLKEIVELVRSGNFHTSGYKSKIIYEPKQRTIYILKFNPDRIVQHAMVNVLEPYFKKYFISDSYACISGRGQQSGSLRCMEALRRNQYCLKCDIHHFYPSIRHDILFNMYKQKIRDVKFLGLLEEIIYSFPGERNCPIGNLLSMWSGNFFLTPVDLLCKHELKIHDYIRYCDDFLLFNNDKKYLHDCRNRIEDFIHNTLDLEFSRDDIFNVKQGVDFLGYRHFNNYILIRKSTAKRMQRKMKQLPEQLESGIITIDEFRSKIDSVIGWLSHANAHNLSESMGLKEMRKKYIKD